MNKRPTLGSIVTVGALGLAAWIAQEGFSARPIMPREGDRWTIAHGATYYPDTGKAVQRDDPAVTREQAADMARQHLNGIYGKCVKDSLPPTTRMSQTEFDVAANFAGQYGCGAWRSSSMRSAYAADKPQEACMAYLQWRYVHSDKQPSAPGWVKVGPSRWRFDCALPGNKVCGGVWTRQKWRTQQCLSAL